MKLNLLYFLSIILFFAPLDVNAQQNNQESNTNIEAFIAKTGAVIIRGFSEIGSIRGQYGTSVTVEAREFINAQDGEKQYGISVEVVGSRDQSHSSYVDSDEIESLMQGLEYISQIDQSVTELDDFQADYKTKDDLVLSTYTSSGKIEFSVQSGSVGRQTAFLDLSDADQLKNFVQQAAQKINSVK